MSTDRQTDTHTHTHTDIAKTLPLPNTREVNMYCNDMMVDSCTKTTCSKIANNRIHIYESIILNKQRRR